MIVLLGTGGHNRRETHVGSDHLQATTDSRTGLLFRLHRVIDELEKLYPVVETYVGTRSSAGAGGSSGGLAVPVNLEVLSFLNGNYWVGELAQDDHSIAPPPCATWARGRTGPRCGHCGACEDAAAASTCRYKGCGADPDNWRAGLKPTVLGLERSVRASLGFGQVQRQQGTYAGHGEDPRIQDALGWLRKVSYTLVDDHPQLGQTVRDEIARVAARCKGMVHGGRLQLDSVWNECQHCHLTTVCSDQVERAVCVNVDCRRPDGTRHCWQVDEDGAWVEVDEPDGRRGRGRNLSDERVGELTREADEIKRAAGG